MTDFNTDIVLAEIQEALDRSDREGAMRVL